MPRSAKSSSGGTPLAAAFLSLSRARLHYEGIGTVHIRSKSDLDLPARADLSVELSDFRF